MEKRIVEYAEINRKWIVFKYPIKEIKRETKLIVRPGQAVVLVHNGRIADVFEPGDYSLDSESTTKLAALGQVFGISKDVVSADLYFINTTVFMNNGWGTKNPVVRRDSELGAVRLTAFGNYSFRIVDINLFINEVFGTRIIGFETQETMTYISNMISQYISVAMGESEFSIMDISTQYAKLADVIKENVNNKLKSIGVMLTEVFVEHIGTTNAVNQAIDEYAEMNLAMKNFDMYEKFNKVKATREAVSTPGNAMAFEFGSVYGKAVAKLIDLD